MRAKIVFLFLLVAAGGSGYLIYSGRLKVPDTWNPWAPVRIAEPLHWLTKLKLSRLASDDAMCLAVLAESGMRYEPVPDRRPAPGCGFDNAVRITRTTVAVGEPFTLSCRSAVALALWERHVVHPTALAYFGEELARIEHFGSYACRNIYGRKDAPLSRHATADALDVAGFVLNDGRRIRVARDWSSAEKPGLFLRDVRNGACRVFDSVLGPEYNAAHRDHFHLDRGGWRACR
jgi:hypothetical protein